MRFNVLNDLSASTEEIGVVKVMSKNCEVAVNIVARALSLMNRPSA